MDYGPDGTGGGYAVYRRGGLWKLIQECQFGQLGSIGLQIQNTPSTPGKPGGGRILRRLRRRTAAPF